MFTYIETRKEGESPKFTLVEYAMLTHGMLQTSSGRPDVQEELIELGFEEYKKKIERQIEPMSTIFIPTGIFIMSQEIMSTYEYIGWTQSTHMK